MIYICNKKKQANSIHIKVLVLRNQHPNFGGMSTKVRVGFCYLGTQKFNAGFVKPTLYNIFSCILFNNLKRNSKLVWFSSRLFRGSESQAYKIEPVLFLLVLCFLAATKTLFKINEKTKSRLKFLIKLVVWYFEYNFSGI